MRGGGFHLFAYGTLRRGSSLAAALLGDCRVVDVGSVRGTLYDLGEYPALLLSGDDRVDGEVWWCPVRTLAALDAYEGVAEGVFRRAAVRVGEYACWVYVAGPRLGPRLVSKAVRRG